MDCHLTVDTDGLRRAAALLDEASRIYGLEHLERLDTYLPDSALSSSPTAREAAAMVRARTVQAAELTRRLADAVADIAAELRRLAGWFEISERLCLAGG